MSTDLEVSEVEPSESMRRMKINSIDADLGSINAQELPRLDTLSCGGAWVLWFVTVFAPFRDVHPTADHLGDFG